MIGYDDYLAVVPPLRRYAAVVDAGDWDRWPELFVDDCIYKVQPRENHERGFPLATMAFESKGMLKDRAYAIRETLFHDPYYQRHVVGLPRRARRRRRAHPRARRTTRCSGPSRASCRRCSTSAATSTRSVRTPEGLRFESRSASTTAS